MTNRHVLRILYDIMQQFPTVQLDDKSPGKSHVARYNAYENELMEGWSLPTRQTQASIATQPSSAHLMTRGDARKLALAKLTEKHQMEDFLEKEAADARV